MLTKSDKQGNCGCLPIAVATCLKKMSVFVFLVHIEISPGNTDKYSRGNLGCGFIQIFYFAMFACVVGCQRLVY